MIPGAGETVRGHDFQQVATDGLFVQDDAVDAVDTGRRLGFRQQLQCAYAIASDGGQQVEGFGGPRPAPPLRSSRGRRRRANDAATR